MGKALAKVELVPIFTNFCFTGNEVYAYDHAVGIYAGLGKKIGSFGVHGQTLLGLLKNSKAENVEFKIGEREVEITNGKSKFKLPFAPKENFLFEEPKLDQPYQIEVNNAFMEALEDCLVTVGTDQAQEAFMGVYLIDGVLYSCDGDAVTKITTKLKGPTWNVMFPTSFCEALLKVWHETKHETVLLFYDTKWAACDFDSGYTVLGQIKDPKLPWSHEKLITDTLKGRPLKTNKVPVGLDEALTRARVLADLENAPTIITSLAMREISVITETPMGEVKDTLELEHDVGPFAAKVSAKLLQRALKRATSVQFLDNCTVFEGEGNYFQLISNMR